jgi:hypothetical protein
MKSTPKPISITDDVAARYTEPDQSERFDSAVRKVLAYPRAAMLQHEAEHRKAVAANPRRRGPKPKQKYAGHVPGAELSA